MRILFILGFMMLFNSCSNSVVYYNTLPEAKQDFPNAKVKQVMDPKNPHYGKFKVKYKPF